VVEWGGWARQELRECLGDLRPGDGAAEGDLDCIDAAIAIPGNVRDVDRFEGLSGLGREVEVSGEGAERDAWRCGSCRR